MAQYIFGARNKIHIVNLEKTLPMFQEAQEAVRRLVANKGTVLFVGTKRQARDIIREEATRAGMPFVDYRWLGGMLTNYKTVKQSIKRLEEKTAALENAAEGGFNKKEILEMQRDVEKLERSLGGIKNMKGLPDAIFVIDTGYQKGTLVEAEKLGIPVIAVVDTNNSPDGVKYVIPGNDDSKSHPPVLPRHRRRSFGRQKPSAARNCSRCPRSCCRVIRYTEEGRYAPFLKSRSEICFRRPLFPNTAIAVFPKI